MPLTRPYEQELAREEYITFGTMIHLWINLFPQLVFHHLRQFFSVERELYHLAADDG